MQLVDLSLQGVEGFFGALFAVCARGLPGRFAFDGLALGVGPERREHPQRALEKSHVLLADFLQVAEGEHAAEGILHRLAHSILVLGEGLHHVLEIARHHPLHGIAVK